MNVIKNWTHTRGKRVNAIFVGTLISFVGCSSMERSMSLGIASGAAVGTGSGLVMSGGETEATLISAGVGAAVGGIASYFIHGGLENRDNSVRKDTLFNLENHGVMGTSGQVPLSDVGELITLPQVQEDYVDTHVEGRKLIEGHKVWTIQEGSNWDLSKKAEKKEGK